MAHTILVGTDFSNTALNTVHYAMAAAQEIKAEVVLFHLYKISSHTAHSLVSPKTMDDMIARKRMELQKLAVDLSEQYDVDVEGVLRVGDFLDEIKHVIEEYNPMLLALGMPQKSFEQDLMGNTTTAAIYNFKFPVLSIPADAKYKGIKQILFACDLNKGVHNSVLENVRDYAHLFNAVVEVLYVGDKIKRVETQQEIAEALDGMQYYFKNVPSGLIINAILQEARDTNADILVMTPHKHGFWSSLIHRSKTRAMASNGTIPLLSISY